MTAHMRISIIVMILLGTMRVSAQAPLPELNTFLANLLATSSERGIPSPLYISQVFDKIPTADANVLRRSVPELQRLLRSPDPEIRKVGIIAIYCIDQRSDSAELVTPLVPTLLDLLDGPDPQIGALSVRSISGMKPSTPEYVLPRLIAFLGRKEAHNAAGATVVFALARLAGSNDVVGKAISGFLLSPDLTQDVRVETLNALAIPSSNKEIIARVAEDAQPARNEEVRLAAIHALKSIGLPALRLTEPQLRIMAEDTNESDAVRTAAQDFLRIN